MIFTVKLYLSRPRVVSNRFRDTKVLLGTYRVSADSESQIEGMIPDGMEASIHRLGDPMGLSDFHEEVSLRYRDEEESIKARLGQDT